MNRRRQTNGSKKQGRMRREKAFFCFKSIAKRTRGDSLSCCAIGITERGCHKRESGEKAKEEVGAFSFLLLL